MDHIKTEMSGSACATFLLPLLCLLLLTPCPTLQLSLALGQSLAPLCQLLERLLCPLSTDSTEERTSFLYLEKPRDSLEVFDFTKKIRKIEQNSFLSLPQIFFLFLPCSHKLPLIREVSLPSGPRNESHPFLFSLVSSVAIDLLLVNVSFGNWASPGLALSNVLYFFSPVFYGLNANSQV